MSTQSAFTAFANLVKLLPTGTGFLFMFFNSVVTNDGSCKTTEKILTIILIVVCGLLCIFSGFTDCHREGNATHYGIVTISGRLWPHAVVSQDLRLKIEDFGHVLLSLFVLGVLVLLDPNTLNCLYPSLERKWFIKFLPVAAAVISSIAAWFPSKRHGIGYHHNSNSSDYTMLPCFNRDENVSN